MPKTLILPTVILLSAGLVACATSPGSGTTSGRVSQAQMPAYCLGEAAARFDQRPRNMITLPAEPDQDTYTVFGQFPPNTLNAAFFTCTFTADGQFVSLDREGDSAPGTNPTPNRVSQAQMPAYCLGEAAARFEQRPRNMLTLPAEREQGMYTVFGQFPPNTLNATFFTCSFSADGEFVSLDEA